MITELLTVPRRRGTAVVLLFYERMIIMKRMTAAFLAISMILGASALPADSINPTAIEVSAAETKLAAPKNVKPLITLTTISLEWKSVKGASCYKIYRYDEKSKKYKPAYTTKETSYKITGLKSKKDI